MSHIVQQILLQVFLILLNAFFAMTEIAVISLTPAKLKKGVEEGDKKAKKLLKLVEEPSGFLSTIQIGITLAGFLGSAFAADSFSEYLTDWIYRDLGFTALSLNALDKISVIIITLILSYFTLIFGELVPKRIAMQKPMQVARMACGVVSAVAFIMKPVVWFLSFSTNLILRLLRMKVEAEEESVTAEEIRLMVDLGEEKGTIDKEEGEWIDNVFEFADTTAYDCMTHVSDVEAISANQTPEEIIALIQETGFSRFPVYERDVHNILGILNVRDFFINLNSANPKPLKELLRPAYFVPESLSASVLFEDMRKKKVHLAIVVDEYGETGGVVTMEDLLEEIVGNIYDEFDPLEPAEIEQVSDNLWKISGSADIEDVAQELGISVPEDADYDTLGGMVFSCLRTIPKDGSSLDVTVCGLDIHVDSIKNRRIEQVLVKKVEEPKEEETAEKDKDKKEGA